MPDLNNYIFYFPYRMCMLILPPKCYLEHLETTVYWFIFKTRSLQDDLGLMTNDFSKWIDLPNEIVQVCILPWNDCTLSFISTSNKHKCSHWDLRTLTSVLTFVYLDVLLALPLSSCLPRSHLWFAFETNHITNPVGTVVFLVRTPLADTNSRWRPDPSSPGPNSTDISVGFADSFMLIAVHMHWTSLSEKKCGVFCQQYYLVSEDCME